jgi:hypothetical protein
VPNLAEGLLAIVAGRERAAALYGDLLELAQSHGRAWFVAAYIRTLFSLTWRLVLALFVADIGRQMMFDAAKLYFHATPPSWRTTHSPYLLGQMGPLACVMSTLWFALPFAAVRYGVRDRFVRLTFAIAAGTTVAFLFIPWVSLGCAVATVGIAVVALLSRRWRKPLEVLAWTGGVGLLLIGAADALRLRAPQALLVAHVHGVYAFALVFQLGLLGMAMVCSRMHRLLLERPGMKA